MLKREISVLVAAAMMLATTLAFSSVAAAAPGNNGQGALKANPNAAFGIATAVAHSTDCTICG